MEDLQFSKGSTRTLGGGVLFQRDGSPTPLEFLTVWLPPSPPQGPGNRLWEPLRADNERHVSLPPVLTPKQGESRAHPTPLLPFIFALWHFLSLTLFLFPLISNNVTASLESIHQSRKKPLLTLIIKRERECHLCLAAKKPAPAPPLPAYQSPPISLCTCHFHRKATEELKSSYQG